MGDTLLRKGGKGALWCSVVNLASFPLTFIASVILVRYLSEQDYGLIKIITSFVSIGGVLCSLGLGDTLIKFGSEFIAQGKEYLFWKLFTSVLGLRIVSFLLLLLVICFFQDTLLHAFSFPEGQSFFITYGLFILFFQNLNRVLGKALFSPYVRFGEFQQIEILKVIILTVGYWIVAYVNAGVHWVLIVQIFAVFFAFVYIVRKARLLYIEKKDNILNSKNNIFDKNLQKKIKKYSFYSFFQININTFRDIAIDNIIIGHYMAHSDVGMYAFASGLVMLVLKFNPVSMFIAVLTSVVMHRYAISQSFDDLCYAYRFLVKLAVFVLLPLFLVIILLYSEIIVNVYAGKFANAYYIVCILSVCFLVMSLIGPLRIVLKTVGRNEIFAFAGFLSIYNLIMDIVLIPRIGVMGATIATGSAGVFQFFLYIYFTYSIVGIKVSLPYLSLLKILVNCFPVCFGAFIISYFTPNLIELFLGIIALGIIYLVTSSMNKVFSSSERTMMNLAIGKNIWVF